MQRYTLFGCEVKSICAGRRRVTLYQLIIEWRSRALCICLVLSGCKASCLLTVVEINWSARRLVEVETRSSILSFSKLWLLLLSTTFYVKKWLCLRIGHPMASPKSNGFEAALRRCRAWLTVRPRRWLPVAIKNPDFDREQMGKSSTVFFYLFLMFFFGMQSDREIRFSLSVPGCAGTGVLWCTAGLDHGCPAGFWDGGFRPTGCAGHLVSPIDWTKHIRII